MSADIDENHMIHTSSSDSRVRAVLTTNPEVDRATSNERHKDLNFKVPAEFHRQFKMTAVGKGLKMNELLFRCFAAYLEKDDG